MYEARNFDELPDIELTLRSILIPSFALPTLSTERPLWLYGDGNLGRMARECLRSAGREIAGISDCEQVCSLSLELPRDVQVAVCVITEPYVPIARNLARCSFDDAAPFYDLWEGARGDHPLANGWVARAMSVHGVEKIAGVWHRWDDDASRAHHLQFLAWRCLREEWVLPGATVRNDDRYFVPEVASVLNDHETFLDGGACDGATSVKFANLVGDYRRIVAVEPDAFNRHSLIGALHSKDKIALSNCALSDKDGYGRFLGGYGMMSKLSSTSQRSVPTLKIDSLDVAPTFVKLHLEGGEFDALLGAAKTLEKCRPIVAATVYHDADGLWRTADWLMEALDGYRFLFRNHCWCGAGAVVYAIPNERNH